MKSFKIIIGISFLLIVSCSSHQKPQPIITNGLLDLRNWDLEKDGAVNLNGNWEFYFARFLSSSDFDSLQRHTYINIPEIWENIIWQGKKLPVYGFASYRLKVLVNPKARELAFRFTQQPVSAYKLFINNELVSTGGITGMTKEASSPYYKKPLLNIKIVKDTLDLVFWVSNFHYWKSGLLNIGQLGTPEKMKYQSDAWLFHNSFVLGAYLIFFLNFFFIYLFRTKETTYLYFSVWCLVLVIRIASTGEMVIMRLFPALPWELLIKLELGSMYLLGIFGSLYWKTFRFEKVGNLIVNILIIYGLVNTIIILFTPASFYSGFLGFGKAYLLISMLYFFGYEFSLLVKKKEGHVYIFIGMIAFYIGSLNEILSTVFIPFLDKDIFNNANGFFVFFITLAIYLSSQYSRAYTKVEKLSGELSLHKEELEKKVIERTQELAEEKEKTVELLEKSDKLLLNILPEAIAARLKEGETTIADHFNEASIMFIDIVDFTKMSAKSQPREMVSLLNDIFTKFDKLAASYGLEKIKTIGDCYMAAAGIPEPRKDHAEAIALMAIEAMQAMAGYKTDGGNEIKFRIGLDCGPIVAGVIGEQKFIYDLWGDPVNTASRMEYFGVIGKIQCTDRFARKLRSDSNGLGIRLEERGEVEIKGKGVMRTWFLEKEKLSMGEKIEIE